jgi:proteasome accessory factor B
MGQLLIGRRDRQKFLSIFMERRRNSTKTLFRPRSEAERVLNAVSFRSTGAEEVDPRIMKVVTRAVAERLGLAFVYRRPGEERHLPRRVLPYHVVCIDGRFYLLGRDLDLGSVRKFVVGRMVGVRCTGVRFERPVDFSADEFLEKRFGAMTGGEDYEVIVVFDAWATDNMRGRRWHPDQIVAELADGRSVFCMRVSCLEEIERWVLSWGSHVRVIEPSQLVDRVLQTMAEAEATYRPNF